MRFGNLLLVLLLHTLLYSSLLHALENNQTNSSIALLPQSKIISADDIFDINSTTSRANFKSTNKTSLLFAKSTENIWVELNFNTGGFEEPLLYLDSPLFSKLKIYDSNGLLLRDLSYSKRQQMTLLPYFRLQKNSTIKLYLQLQSRFMPVVTGLNLTTKAKFLQHDSETKFYNTLTLGIVTALLLFLLLYLYYSKKIELLYLIVFILSVLYFQLTYSGFTQILTSHYYALLDLSISSVKINLIALSLFLYSVSLLNTDKKSRLYFILKLFAFISLVEIFIVGFINMNPYYAIIPLLAMLFFAILALLKVTVISKRIELIFTLLGYLLLLTQFSTLAFAPLQEFLVNSGLQRYFSLFTALFVLLITMSYILNFIRKQQCDLNLLISSHERKFLLDNMLKSKKEELDALNKSKELLTHNIHTIIDNNLNKIVHSIQTQESCENLSQLSTQLATTEQRMQATSICYTHMLSKKDLANIEMQSVIEDIIAHIETLYSHEECRADIHKDIDATLAINDAVMASTAISEFLMDSFKNACEHNVPLRVSISLHNSKTSYKLKIKALSKQQEIATSTPLQKLKQKLQQLRLGGKKLVQQ